MNVFLIQRPTDPLYGTALILAFNLQRMNCLAGVFDHRVTGDVGPAGFLVNLSIYDVQSETGAGAFLTSLFSGPLCSAVVQRGFGTQILFGVSALR